MVLEELYSVETLRKHAVYPFLLGLTHAIFGIATAVLLFPEDPTLVAVGITALVLLPSIKGLVHTTNIAKSDKNLLAQAAQNSKKTVSAYLAVFLGLLVSFGLFSLLLPSGAAHYLFKHQLDLLAINILDPSTTFGSARALFLINVKVLFVCFLASFVDGTAALFVLTWNASVFGTVFGAFAKSVMEQRHIGPALAMGGVFVAVLPHTIIEALAYIIAGVSGTLLSHAVLNNRWTSPVTVRAVTTAIYGLFLSLAVLILGAFVESTVPHRIIQLLF